MITFRLDMLIKFLWLLAAVVTVGLFYSAPLGSLHQKWSALNESYSHGYLILFIAMYWLVSGVYTEVPTIKPSLSAFPFAMGVAGIWYFGWATQMLIVEQAVLPLVILTFLIGSFGLRIILTLGLPLAFIYLAIPAWDALLPALRALTTGVVQYLVVWTGIPALLDGFRIELPYGVLKIADGCAGLNYLLMGLVIGVVRARQIPAKTWQKAIIVGIALVFALVANWIRVFLLVLIGYYSDMKSGLVYDHGTFGWVIFAITLLFYFATIHSFVGKFVASSDSETVSTPENQPSASNCDRKPLLILSLVFCLCFCVFFFPVYWASVSEKRSGSGVVKIPAEFSDTWIEKKSPSTPVKYGGWDRAYYWKSSRNRDVELQAYIYTSQKQGKEMIYYSNIVAEEDRIVLDRQLGGAPGQGSLDLVVVKGAYQDVLVISNYRIGDVFTTSRIKGKFYQFLEALKGNTRTAFLVYAKKCEKKLCEKEMQKVENDKNEILSYLQSPNWLSI